MELDSLQSLKIGQHSTKKKLVIQAKCISDNQSILACNNPQCKQYAFVCGSKLCQCRTIHKKCLFTCSDQILDIIEEKKSQSNLIIDKVSVVCDKWIDQISKTRQKIQEILQDWGLSPAEKKFIDLIRNSEYKKLTGQHINEITKQTTSYFQQQVKEKLLSQIQATGLNYNAQIKSILNTFIKLFDKISINQNDFKFKEEKMMVIDRQYNFIEDFQDFRKTNLMVNETKKTKNDYLNLANYLKGSLKTDFYGHLGKYKASRRVYGSKALREKYFQDYFKVLLKGQEHMEKWKKDTQDSIKHISKLAQQQLIQLSNFHREFESQIQFPFTIQTALSLHRAFNVIHQLINYIQKNGKQMVNAIVNMGLNVRNEMQNKDLFVLSIYFLDGLMDEHPQIDELQVLWMIIRFEDKFKSEVNLLLETINQTIKEAVHVEISVNNN